jgi:hypothetical protein
MYQGSPGKPENALDIGSRRQKIIQNEHGTNRTSLSVIGVQTAQCRKMKWPMFQQRKENELSKM